MEQLEVEQESMDTDDEVFVHAPSSETAPTNDPSEGFSVSRNSLGYFVVAGVFLALGILLGMNIGGGGVTGTQVRTIVQDVVSQTYADQLGQLEEALVSVASTSDGGAGVNQETLAAMIQAAVAEAIAAQVDYLEDDDPYLGPEDAPIIMVEFSDFLCPFCERHFQETLTPLLENYDGYIRYVYRDFPGVGGQNAYISAMAAECANDQGAFWPYHNTLFSNQSAIGVQDMNALRQVLIDFASDLELDTDTFANCLINQEHYVDVIRDLQDAQANGARGTPAFFINGEFVSGAQPYEVFASIIDQQLEELGIERDPDA